MDKDIREMRECLHHKKAGFIRSFLGNYYNDDNFDVDYTDDMMVLIKPLDGDISGTGRVINDFLKNHEDGTILLKKLKDKAIYYFIPYDCGDVEAKVREDYGLRLSCDNK